MKNKVKLAAALFLGVAFLFVCCGGSSSGEGNEQSSATESSTTVATSVAVADPEAKSESKGVGKFTSVEIGELDAGMAEKGKAIFESKCASCHKTTGEKLVGPGIKGITERRTPEWIMNMITNPQEMTQQDPVAKALLEKHLIQMTFQNVSDDETRQILEYFRQNDKL